MEFGVGLLVYNKEGHLVSYFSFLGFSPMPPILPMTDLRARLLFELGTICDEKK